MKPVQQEYLTQKSTKELMQQVPVADLQKTWEISVHISGHSAVSCHIDIDLDVYILEGTEEKGNKGKGNTITTFTYYPQS